jgi:hypothetical protein
MKDYGGSSTYQYEVRSRLTSIVAKGDLIRTARGVYIVSPQGRERYRILLEREGSLDA